MVGAAWCGEQAWCGLHGRALPGWRG
jgi:hypothetical protein